MPQLADSCKRVQNKNQTHNTRHNEGTTQPKLDAHSRHMQHQARAGILPTNSHEILHIDVLKMKTIQVRKCKHAACGFTGTGGRIALLAACFFLLLAKPFSCAGFRKRRQGIKLVRGNMTKSCSDYNATSSAKIKRRLYIYKIWDCWLWTLFGGHPLKLERYRED